jgi:FkbM family methyltransferase
MKTIDKQPTVFDQDHYLKLINARGAFIRSIVPQLSKALSFSTALDAGCGVGFFADLLHNCGLSVTAFDGRLNNVQEARERYPHLSFQQGDVQDPAILRLGAFDFVLCFGLLYHLENPLLAIRHLRSLTRTGLLLESMCLTDKQPIMELREEPSLDDQSLTDVALYPSESCLVKMLYLAGFSHVYKADPLPEHEQFLETRAHSRRRTVLFACSRPVFVPGLIPFGEPAPAPDPWTKTPRIVKRIARRALNFVKKPGREKFRSFAFRWVRRFPLPLRLPFGAWWIARNTILDLRILGGTFEESETSFVQAFVRPGMTVLDLGAHHGYYTLSFSKSVGPQGKVFAFEPSERERRVLRMHLRLNSCSNVQIIPLAMGSAVSEQDLYQVSGAEDSCNSLRPPAVHAPTEKTRVRVSTVDEFLLAQNLNSVGFVKVDVEGGERDVLLGARRLFAQKTRPVFLIEVSDLRTGPWGYRAAEIIRCFLEEKYEWFEILPDGLLSPAAVRENYDDNLVAIPVERKADLLYLFSGPTLTI